jgi:hypothetical protein
VASNTGKEEPAPARVTRLSAPVGSPIVNNLERVSSIKPLRSVAGAPEPAPQGAQP